MPSYLVGGTCAARHVPDGRAALSDPYAREVAELALATPLEDVMPLGAPCGPLETAGEGSELAQAARATPPSRAAEVSLRFISISEA